MPRQRTEAGSVRSSLTVQRVLVEKWRWSIIKGPGHEPLPATVIAALLALVPPGRTTRINGAADEHRMRVQGNSGAPVELWGDLSESEGNIVATRVGVIAHEIIRTARSAETGQILH